MPRADRRVLVVGSSVGAYVMIAALRRHAAWVGVVLDPHQPGLARLSRFADYHVVLPARPENPGDSPGLPSRENSASYAAAMLGEAVRRSVTHIVPVQESDMIALAYFRGRFDERGIVVCCSDHHVIELMSDKYQALRAAQEHGVPAPRVRLLRPQREERASRANAFGYPVIVKARTSWGAIGVRLARNAAELDVAAAALETTRAAPSLQEYVPGGTEPSLTALVADDGRMVVQIWLRKMRYAGPSRSCCVVTTPPIREAAALSSFLRASGLRGPVGVQFKWSATDRRNLLIEVNPRLGQNAKILVRLCAKLGVDFGELFLSCFGAGRPVGRISGLVAPAGHVGVALPDDILAFAKYLSARMHPGERPDNPFPSLRSYVRSYVDAYRRMPVVDVLAASVLSDPAFAIPAVVQVTSRIRREPYNLVPFGDVGYLARPIRSPAPPEQLAGDGGRDSHHAA